MRSTLIMFSLIAATALAVALYPASQAVPVPSPTPGTAAERGQQPIVEVVFVLDTTGSMGGLIDGAKRQIWAIAANMAQAEPVPKLRIGLVAFRDRGDAYVTRVVDLSSDLDGVYAALMDFEAAGGGDGPEAVNEALHAAVHRVSWSQDARAYRSIFLLGDAPPHMDYADDVKYPLTLAAARQRNIVVNTVQCGSSPATQADWMQIAQLAQGRYFQVDADGGAVAVSTEYDARIAALSAQLDETRLYFGSPEQRAEGEGKLADSRKLHAAAPVTSRAGRAAYNQLKAGARNFLGDNELVDAVSGNRVKLEEIPAEALPASLRRLSPEQRRVRVRELASQRRDLEGQISELAARREAQIAEQVRRLGKAGVSLEDKIQSAVREQAADSGLRYEDASGS